MRKPSPTISLSLSTLAIISCLTNSVNALPIKQPKMLARRDIFDSNWFWILVILCPTIFGAIAIFVRLYKDRERILYRVRYGESKPKEIELSRCWGERGAKVNIDGIFIPAVASEQDLWQCWRVHGTRYREDEKARFLESNAWSGNNCA